MSTMPIVSVIMPAYNAGDYLRPAIDSILAQTLRDFELLLVDDGSTDGSTDELMIAQLDSRVRIIRQTNSGKPTAVNRAMKAAASEWIAIQDADDVASPRRLERLIEKVRAEPELGAVFSGYDLLVKGKQIAPITRAKDVATCREVISNFGMPSHDPTIMFRRDLGLEVRYDEELRIGEGHDFILRMGEIAPMAVVPENLYSYRVAWNSLTRNDPYERQRYVARVLQKACQRRGIDFSSQFPDLIETGQSSVLADNGIHRHFIESVMSSRERGNQSAAWKSALQSIGFKPDSLRYYWPLAYVALPLPIIQWLRHSRRRREQAD